MRWCVRNNPVRLDMLRAVATKQWASSKARMCSGLTHVSKDGKPTMVDVSDKAVTKRFAHARSIIRLPASMVHILSEGGDVQSKKGPVFATAIIAGTMGAKRTSELIPFCHPLPLEDCKVSAAIRAPYSSLTRPSR